MKKKKNPINILIALVIFIFLVCLFSGGRAAPEKSDGTYEVKIVTNLKEAGDLTLAYKEGDVYHDVEGDSLKVAEGTKIKAYFPNGMNEGYEVYGWGYDSNGFMTFIQLESEDGTDSVVNYNEEKYVKTIKEDMTIYFYAKESGVDYHVVSFYDSSLVSKRTPIGLALVKDGEDASVVGVIPQSKTGFDMTGWSKPIENIKEDIDVYPTYTSNVFTMFRDYRPMFAHGLIVTLELSIISVSLAMFFGIVICLIRMSNLKIMSGIVTAYVEIIRGIPLLLQLLLVYTLIGPTRVSFGSFLTTEVLSCIITLTINSSAYSSEIFRSGLQAVDKGQIEAARALGISKWKTNMKIVIPQGIRNSLPSIVNELVAMIKETSLAVSVDASIGELMCVRKNITAATFINLPPYIIVAIIYFCVTYSLSKFVGVVEKRLAERD